MKRNTQAILLIVMFMACISIAFADSQPVTADITINPNPMEKSTLITVTFTQRTHAEIIIETLYGNIVKSLYSGNVIAGSYEFFWDRLSDSGVFVPEGEYSVTINYNSRYTSTKKTIILK